MTNLIISMHLLTNYIIIRAKKKDIVGETNYENLD